MTFSCREMVWGVDWIHLVWVGVGIKKPGGSLGLEICMFDDSEASRTWAQKLGEMRGERNE